MTFYYTKNKANCPVWVYSFYQKTKSDKNHTHTHTLIFKNIFEYINTENDLER